MPKRSDVCVIRYNVGGRIVFHSRIVVAHDPASLAGHFYTLNPDGEVWEEDLNQPPGNDSVRRIAWLPCLRGYPADIPVDKVYEFDENPTRAELAAAMFEAHEDFESVSVPTPADLAWTMPVIPVAQVRALIRDHAAAGFPIPPDAEVLPMPLAIAGPVAVQPPVVHAPAGLAALAAALAPPVVPANGIADPRGVLVPPRASLGVVPLALPGVAGQPLQPLVVAPIAAAHVVNIRLHDIAYDLQGSRFREYREAVLKLTESPWPDWPVPGPRTTLWLCRFFLENGGSPLAWFSKFRHDGGLAFSDEGIEELERSCRYLQSLLCYDQVNASELASVELLCRAIQVTAYGHMDRFLGSRDDSFERGILYGTTYGEGNLPISPKLKEHMGAELSKRNVLDKERRKAVEVRTSYPNAKQQRDRKARGGGGKGGPEL